MALPEAPSSTMPVVNPLQVEYAPDIRVVNEGGTLRVRLGYGPPGAVVAVRFWTGTNANAPAVFGYTFLGTASLDVPQSYYGKLFYAQAEWANYGNPYGATPFMFDATSLSYPGATMQGTGTLNNVQPSPIGPQQAGSEVDKTQGAQPLSTLTLLLIAAAAFAVWYFFIR